MTNEEVWKALETVKDPEIHSISIVDLGMVEQVDVRDEAVSVCLLPTFLGCPALDIIRTRVEEAVKQAGASAVTVEFLRHPPWTSDRISEAGRERLKQFGIAPPPRQMPSGAWQVACPYCGAERTVMENLFGPTACRSIFYCKQCKNPFEAMKPVLISG
ncbi:MULTISPECIES: 1,2-phenylacetyl-CoA epoxidase subunit PaaD [Geobacillus]|uniref:1,2-phenylacetyl-CoA epoxidase subunit PaaD n=1 Tax=Geobacillus proteiniphilus TaxID=860353 RepID=A0A1Q5T5D7_9BACL|nr:MULTISPECIES: 1,2-phenylacetyl-CoA epoxidase subunit PaaD [Geobacillus]MDF9296862.1 phenylacetate-CoA oxygenase subunit PaaJ [Geobacillus stearothermophilus]OKO95418.1 Phenylacetate-CoA oxygenase, PaaJ subunit [Geobacillus proteiniphilus]OPX03875.1 phenylacetate-CoA oxygenase subunit PaaJ [Geobacillus sp. LEMMY01]WKA46111.1 1,2-phenylacetyl-CoA epoxidase subunit PaaD [Geobacillus zalihae]WMJ17561.1 1,2-phenylacetyl-CoA epoxidase subunit PaaD [Geobacillus proteiniphilus]